MVDAAAAAAEDPGQALVVHAACPGDSAVGGVFGGPLFLQVCFGSAVVVLLTPESADGISAVVPDHCAGGEAEGAAVFLDAPAEVYVVAGDFELGLKAA